MGKGRKPIPAKIKALRGNQGKRKLPVEPPISAEMPECPANLCDEAKREWNRLAGELSACGVLTMADRAALAAYCQSWARWCEAEAIVEHKGIVIATPTGVKQNPAVISSNSYLAQTRAWAVELGITPSARSKVAGQSQPKKDALESFIGLRVAKDGA